jgi:hypothetical protein
MRDQTGEKNHQWKGGVTMHRGYVMVRMPEHPFAWSNGYVLAHRLVMEKKLGRFLSSKEHVHHKNRDRTDNNISNLTRLDAGPHARIHGFQLGRKFEEGSRKCVDCNSTRTYKTKYKDRMIEHWWVVDKSLDLFRCKSCTMKIYEKTRPPRDRKKSVFTGKALYP